ncbi:MAG: hypothetical protein KAS16_01595 [Thermoplasmata archaeon]|nr:hypothetical protein [Thermoplasmata archaeon]
MHGPIYEIFSTIILSGFRNGSRRLRDHKLYTAWSIILILTVFGSLTLIIAMVLRNLENLAFPIEINEIFFFLFMAMMGKSLLDSYHMLVERPASNFYLIQPMPHWKIITGVLVSIMALNLMLLAIGLGLITMFTLSHPVFHFVIPPYMVLDLILLTLLASTTGLAYGILSGLGTWKRKMVGSFLYSPMISLVWLFLLQLRFGNWELVNMLALLLLSSFIFIPLSSHFLLESWNTMTSSKARSHLQKREHNIKKTHTVLVKRFFGNSVSTIYDKEVRTLLRRREGIGNAITLIGFMVFAFYFYNQLEGFLELPGLALDILPIVIVGLSLFLAVVLLGLVPALGIVSKDGKNTWVFKSMPITGHQIIQGKALSILLMLPFIIVFVAIPVPLMTGLSATAFIFSIMGAMAMYMMATGLGIWHGTKYPNYNEASGNAPDVMSMYTMMMVCLFLFAFMLIPPIAIAFSDKVLGLLALMFSLDIAFLILVLGVRSAGKAYEALDLGA